MKYVYTICYNTLDVWENKQEAIDFYKLCFSCSDGCEHERYANILVDLQFCDIGYDNVDNIVWQLNFRNSKKKIKIDYENYEDVIKKVEEGVYE